MNCVHDLLMESIGNLKHSELEPDYLLAKRNGNASYLLGAVYAINSVQFLNTAKFRRS